MTATINNTISLQHSSQLRAWIVVLTAGLFFFYEFIQLNMFNALDLHLMREFHVNATELGKLSSIYFLSNVLFLLVAGLLLDRFSVRYLVLLTMGICVSGTFVFALSTSFTLAMTARFFTGIGSAFCFLSCIRLASRWLPTHKMALGSGLIVTMGMLGGMVAQIPMTLLVEHMGWRHALLLNGMFGIFCWLLIAVIVRDYPTKHHKQPNSLLSTNFLHAMRLAFINRQNWSCGIYTALLNLPIFLLGAVWGMPYLTQVHHLSVTQASLVTSMLFLGTIIGSPIIGWTSDKVGLRKKPMLIGAVITLLLICSVLYLPQLTLLTLIFLFFAIGFTSSTQIISYPTVAESNPAFLTATSVSVVSFSCISAGGIFQYLFGKLMDIGWQGEIIEGMRVYSTMSFHLACLIMPVTCIIAFCLALRIRETYCKPSAVFSRY